MAGLMLLRGQKLPAWTGHQQPWVGTVEAWPAPTCAISSAAKMQGLVTCIL